MNAKNVSFLMGSGCSSYYKNQKQVGVPTMAPMAKSFLSQNSNGFHAQWITQKERDDLKTSLGLQLDSPKYSKNLEKLMEVLFSAQFVLSHSSGSPLEKVRNTIDAVINKTVRHVLKICTEGEFSIGDDSVETLYQAFYQKLIFRDRTLPRPWVFTTNYDLFNETAMDKRGIQYCNGFSGVVERRFNPATFRYSLAEQLDITSSKWTAVDNFVYLCKLHGSVNWIEEKHSLFPIRELQTVPVKVEKSDTDELSREIHHRALIYPTPAKQNASFGSPYSDMFREFQRKIVTDQSVLFVLGYSFGDEHVNNIIFQALTIPNFRLIAFVPPDADGVVRDLRELGDPRVWLIGGDGPDGVGKAHYFDTFVDHFMPEPPGDKIDTAVARVLEKLTHAPPSGTTDDGGDNGI